MKAAQRYGTESVQRALRALVVAAPGLVRRRPVSSSMNIAPTLTASWLVIKVD